MLNQMKLKLFSIITKANEEGKIIDHFGGQALEDIKNKRVRVVSDPYDRFGEDRLRILRIPRFHSRFSDKEITLDSRTADAINYYKNLRGTVQKFNPEGGLEAITLSPVSDERIQQEFESGLSKSINVVSFLHNYVKLDLLSSGFPNLQITLNGLQNTKNKAVILAFILKTNPPDKVRNQLNKLKWKNIIVDEVFFLLKAISNPNVRTALELTKKPNRRQDLKELINMLGIDSDEWNHFLSYSPITHSGEDITKQFNISSPGPEVGLRQKELQNQHFNNSFKDYVKRKDSN